ncbi:membrane protein [Terrihabitans soli]|uniref:Membrane protein n=1 Tax=Terrihabitans soli TaxID=708113 RepID=A0A6S6QSI1_9HYPH|nr:peptidoglycan DD-metalloendopeptidase family protein [Terrihabitans soli]BCJ89418.1 membrane protein [Terrihabitans soli]
MRPRTTRQLIAGAIGAGLFAVAFFAAAQETAPEAVPEELNIRRENLGKSAEDLGRTKEMQQKLRAEIQQLAEERSRLSAELVATAARARDTEAKMSASEAKLADLADTENDIRKKFESRRAVVAELLAALQRMGRNPPPTLLVQPEDALASIRSAIVLGAVLPEIREQAEELAADLEELGRIRREAVRHRNLLAADKADLLAAQQRLGLLVEVRQTKLKEREQTLAGETRKAAELGRQVQSLEDLIARMEKDVDAARKAAEAAAAAPEPPPPPTGGPRQDLAALSDPGRMAPAVAFGSAKGLLPLPVSGTRLRSFGETDDLGSSQKGLTISTRSQAQVTAPCDGWVVYAGPFRSYGQLLILNAGGGYHVLLAGMEKISVSLGQFVLTGEPVAEMGAASGQIVSVVGGAARQPVLYVEFRKDGQSIDPGPWWALNSEKVRG